MATTEIIPQRGLKFLLNIAEEIIKVDDELPIRHLAVLLLVAKQPGSNFSELVEALGAPTSVVSRIMRKMSGSSGYATGHIPNLGLIKVVGDAVDGRVRRAYLSEKGERFVRRLATIVEGDEQ